MIYYLLSFFCDNTTMFSLILDNLTNVLEGFQNDTVQIYNLTINDTATF